MAQYYAMFDHFFTAFPSSSAYTTTYDGSELFTQAVLFGDLFGRTYTFFSVKLADGYYADAGGNLRIIAFITNPATLSLIETAPLA